MLEVSHSGTVLFRQQSVYSFQLPQKQNLIDSNF